MLLHGLFGEPVIDSGTTVVWDMSMTTGSHRVDDSDIVDLDLLFDPVKTGFPLVLRPGQRLQLYDGQASAFNAWLLSMNPDAAVSLLIEDEGVAREVPLELIVDCAWPPLGSLSVISPAGALPGAGCPGGSTPGRISALGERLGGS